MGKTRKKKIAIWISVVIVIAILAGYTYIYSQMNKVNTVAIPKGSAELNISDEAAQLDSSIINIALFGLSNNYDGEDNSADSIMVLSIDQKRNKLKVSSIMRDTYVELADGRGANNIKNAYRFGGPALAIKTLNSNYDLNIKNYLTVNYEGFEKLIDSIGGVEIEIKDYEVPLMKQFGITSGKNTLSGKEALVYSMDRTMGNGDFERTERHRTVLAKIFEKLQSFEMTKYPAIISDMLPYVETNMNKGEILSLATTVFPNMKTFEASRFPVDGYWFEDKKLGEYYYIVANIKTTAYQMHRFIYYDSKPVGKY